MVSPQLVLLGEQFEKLEKLSFSLRKSFASLGSSKALDKISRAGVDASISLDKSSAAAARLERRLAALRLPAGGMIPPLLPGGGGGAFGGGGGRGSGGSAGGHAGGGFHGGNIHMGSGGIGIGSVGMAAGDAFVPLAVSAGMIWGGHALYESAKDLNTEMQRFKLYGLGDKLNAEAFSFVKGMHIYGSTQAENMKNFREAQGVFRESGLNDSEALSGAKLAAPVLANIAFATEALDDEPKARMRTSSMSMMRWVEMNGGLKSAENFNRLANVGWKLTQSSGGNVDWEQLRQFSATAGIAGQSISAEGLAALEPVIGELKGGRAGVGLRTALNRMMGVVKLPNQVAHMLVDHGLWDGSKVVWNNQGGIKSFKGDPFKFTKEMMQNAPMAYRDHFMPMYDQMHLGTEERSRMNAMFFGSTGGAEFNIMDKQMPTIERSVEAIRKFADVITSVNNGREGLSGQEIEFGAAWTDFKTDFGTQVLPFFSGLLKFGSGVLRGNGPLITQSAPDGLAHPNVPIVNGIGGVWGLEVKALRKLFGMDSGTGINPVAPANQNKAALPPVIQLVPTQGGRPLAEYNAKNLAKHQFGGLGSGTFDYSVAAPGMNNKG